ncbi:MAG: hypothetical protein KME22_06685 [Hassallia sp. WJT32-NPBG1]|jgi:DNA-directed RNA polymerase alpha subunit|nr:hypothetical protein [Hassallia sp. WJT32-NPBG1]
MKSKGGRAKKAQYTTVVMRIPTPIRADVERLLAEFYASIPEKPVAGTNLVKVQVPVTSIESVEGEKPVTGIEVLGLSKRLYLILQRYQINTVEDLQRCSRKELEARPGFGRSSLLNLNTALIEKGYQPIRSH